MRLGPTERSPLSGTKTTQGVETLQGWADPMPPGMVREGLFKKVTFRPRHKEGEGPRSGGRAFQEEGTISAKA